MHVYIIIHSYNVYMTVGLCLIASLRWNVTICHNLHFHWLHRARAYERVRLHISYSFGTMLVDDGPVHCARDDGAVQHIHACEDLRRPFCWLRKRGN